MPRRESARTRGWAHTQSVLFTAPASGGRVPMARAFGTRCADRGTPARLPRRRRRPPDTLDWRQHDRLHHQPRLRHDVAQRQGRGAHQGRSQAQHHPGPERSGRNPVQRTASNRDVPAAGYRPCRCVEGGPSPGRAAADAGRAAPCATPIAWSVRPHHAVAPFTFGGVKPDIGARDRGCDIGMCRAVHKTDADRDVVF
jgi:hypothetical protein